MAGLCHCGNCLLIINPILFPTRPLLPYRRSRTDIPVCWSLFA